MTAQEAFVAADRLRELIDDMLRPNPVNTAPADSASNRAYGIVMSSADPALLHAAQEAVVIEKDKHRRRLLYLIISKVGAKLHDLGAGPFLIRQIERESDKWVLLFLLDGIADLPKPRETDLTAILRCLEDERWQVRNSAIEALRGTESSRAEEALIKLLQTSTNHFDLVSANATLNRIGTLQAIPAIEPHLKSRKRDVKMSARFAIDEIRKRAELTQR